MRRITHLIIHSTSSPPSQDIGRRELDRAHRKRGFLKIGYHYVIRRCGKIEEGRAAAEIGAHAEGHNQSSIGIALVGGVDAQGAPAANYEPEQIDALFHLVGRLETKYPTAEVVGHRDLVAGKACPAFNVSHWLQTGEVIP